MNSYWLNKNLKYLNCNTVQMFYKTFGNNADIKSIVKDIQIKIGCTMLDRTCSVKKLLQKQSSIN